MKRSQAQTGRITSDKVLECIEEIRGQYGRVEASREIEVRRVLGSPTESFKGRAVEDLLTLSRISR